MKSRYGRKRSKTYGTECEKKNQQNVLRKSVEFLETIHVADTRRDGAKHVERTRAGHARIVRRHFLTQVTDRACHIIAIYHRPRAITGRPSITL